MRGRAPTRSATAVWRASFPVLLALGWLGARAQNAAPEIRLGSGEHVFVWERDWPRLPEGMSLGNTHGSVVVDSADRVYVNTDTENAVVVFELDGTFVRAWGKELAGGLHGMTLAREDGREVLYLAHTGRHEVLKATLEGEILWTLGFPEESGVYADASQYRPTSVAVTPDGTLFVADGYGASWIHQFSRERRWVRSFGGPGSEPGRLATPHGLLLRSGAEGPELLVADRENHRLQHFDLEGELLPPIAAELRRPCNAAAEDGTLAIADLAGRVTLLDADGGLIAHLGDNPNPEKRAQNGVPRADWRDGEFIAPHSAAWDSRGNLYVVDWLALGRVTKLVRVR